MSMTHGEDILRALAAEPSTAVLAIGLDGTLLYCNQQAVSIYRSPEEGPDDLIGRNVRELAPSEYIEDRMRVLRQIAEDGAPRVLRTVWRGRQLASWVQYVPRGEDAGDVEHLLSITRYVPGDLSPATHEAPTSRAEVVNLGELSVLSARELEVLALLGAGMSAAQIAERLHRSIRTVENHKYSISRKLHASDRVSLMHLAQSAGLTPEDAQRADVALGKEAGASAPRREGVTPSRGVWETLASDPLAGVSIITIDGEILYSNEQALRLYLGDHDTTPELIEGVHLSEIAPEELVAERLALFREIGVDQRPRRVRTIWRGRQILSWIHHLPGDAGAAHPRERADRILIVARHVEGDVKNVATDAPGEILETQVADLGPLATLTPRELEVLALIGQGHSLAETAKILFRSLSTIESHRASIGQKLGGAGREELVLLARRAGLTLRDARVPRASSTPVVGSEAQGKKSGASDPRD